MPSWRGWLGPQGNLTAVRSSSTVVMWEASHRGGSRLIIRLYVGEENAQKVVRFFSSGRILFPEGIAVGQINYRVLH